MPKGFPKVKEMVDALLADPLATFATSAKCTIHGTRCPIPKAADALSRIYAQVGKSTGHRKRRKSM